MTKEHLLTAKQPALGRLFTEWREALGYSQADLAERSGISRRQIQYIESGKVGLGSKNRERLQAFLAGKVQRTTGERLEAMESKVSQLADRVSALESKS